MHVISRFHRLLSPHLTHFRQMSHRITSRPDGQSDIFSSLLNERIVCLLTPIDEKVAGSIIAQLLLLQAQDPVKPIQLIQPGGLVTAGLAIYDTIQHVTAPVVCWCVGQACSMASLLLAAGSPGKRYSLPNSRIMIHQPSAFNISGTASDIMIQSDEIARLKDKVIDLYAHHCGKESSLIKTAIERDNYMSPEEAMAFGVIDKVMRKIPATKKAKEHAEKN